MNFAYPERQYSTSGHLVYKCCYHVIFCPKYRRSVLQDGIDVRLKELITEIAEQWDFEVMDMEVMPDYVHLLISCNPRFGIMQCISRIKGTTSRQLRKEFPALKSRLPCLWTRSCFVATVGSVSLEVVKQYIDDQKKK